MIDNTTITTIAVAGLTAIAPTVLAWATLISSRKNGREGRREAYVIIRKAEEIHTLTNSHLNQVMGDLRVAREEIKGLREMVVSLIKNQNAPPPAKET